MSNSTRQEIAERYGIGLYASLQARWARERRLRGVAYDADGRCLHCGTRAELRPEGRAIGELCVCRQRQRKTDY